MLKSQGILDDNPVYLKALEYQNGDEQKALEVLAKANIFLSGPEIGGTGAIDAFLGLPGKKFSEIAKNMLKRAGVEGVQEYLESAIALSSLNDLLGLTGTDDAINIQQNAAGNIVMGTLTGGATTISAAPVEAAVDLAAAKSLDSVESPSGPVTTSPTDFTDINAAPPGTGATASFTLPDELQTESFDSTTGSEDLLNLKPFRVSGDFSQTENLTPMSGVSVMSFNKDTNVVL